MTAPVCPYCRSTAVLTDSARIYNGRSYGPVWVCAQYPECDAYVGCHPGTNEPLGRLANRTLRDAKQRAHACFDPLWVQAPRMYPAPQTNTPKQRRKAHKRIRQAARTRAYAWLAERLGLEKEQCHIGMFSVEQCDQVVAVCKTMTPEKVRAWAKSRETA